MPLCFCERPILVSVYTNEEKSKDFRFYKTLITSLFNAIQLTKGFGQWGKHVFRKLPMSTMRLRFLGVWMAQSVEYRTLNLSVVSLSPTLSKEVTLKKIKPPKKKKVYDNGSYHNSHDTNGTSFLRKRLSMRILSF